MMFPFVGIARTGASRITGSVSVGLSALLASGTVKRTVKSSAMSAALAKVAASGTIAVASESLLDSFTSSLTSGWHMYNGCQQTGVGQAITLSSAKSISKVKFRLSKYGSPSGNVVAKIYGIAGSVGADGRPTGSALATSDGVSASSLGTSADWVPFTFSTRYSASAQGYCFTVEYNGSDSSNYVDVWFSASGGHGGNQATFDFNTVWNGSSSYDTGFYLYGY
jgi:hypothetical protein